MKLRFFGIISLAMVMCLASVLEAQEGRGQRGQRGGPGGQRGGFGGGFGGGGFQMGGALELMGLLRMEEVRKEVGMADETYEAVREAQPDMRAMFQASPEEREKVMKEANEKAQEMLDEVLEPDQQKRLMGLLVQQNGNRAAANELVAKQIGLDDSGIKKVRDAAEEASSTMRDKMREMFQGGGGPGNFDREKMQEMMEQARKDTDDAIAKVMTADQRTKLVDLKGEKFEFPENRGFGGFGGGRGRPGGAGGPPGGRPRGGGRPEGGNRPGGGRPEGNGNN